MTNTLYIAAGAGKITYLVKEALETHSKMLFTTFTQENEAEIKKRFIELNGFIPSNVYIETWFTFLLRQGVKPYQGNLTLKKITGLMLVNKASTLYTSGSDIDEYYFSSDYKIYSDKLSSFVVKSNLNTNVAVISCISNIFENIFIDEVQDMAGYDFEIIKLLLKTNSKILMAGDPRQYSYSTHNEKKV